MAAKRPTYGDFYRAVLADLGIKPNVGNMRAFGVITIIEGRNKYWNPMNWTLPAHYPKLPGNADGVRMYPSYAVGIRETADALKNNSRWRPFVQSLHNPPDRFVPLRAIAAIYAEWGSHPPFMDIESDRAQALLEEEMPS